MHAQVTLLPEQVHTRVPSFHNHANCTTVPGQANSDHLLQIFSGSVLLPFCTAAFTLPCFHANCALFRTKLTVWNHPQKWPAHLDGVSENRVLNIPGETERAGGNALSICWFLLLRPWRANSTNLPWKAQRQTSLMVRRRRQVMKCRVCYKEWRKLCMTSLLYVKGARMVSTSSRERCVCVCVCCPINLSSVFHEQDVLIFLFPVLHLTFISLTVCVHQSSLSGSVVSSPRGDDVTTETTQRSWPQTHLRGWDKHTQALVLSSSQPL